jgi:hypothetical protein
MGATPGGLHFTRDWVLTPEGDRAVSRADSARSEPAASCAQPARSSSGHIYRSVTLMTPVQAAEIMETTWRLGVRGSVVTRDGRGREEAANAS